MTIQRTHSSFMLRTAIRLFFFFRSLFLTCTLNIDGNGCRCIKTTGVATCLYDSSLNGNLWLISFSISLTTKKKCFSFLILNRLKIGRKLDNESQIETRPVLIWLMTRRLSFQVTDCYLWAYCSSQTARFNSLSNHLDGSNHNVSRQSDRWRHEVYLEGCFACLSIIITSVSIYLSERCIIISNQANQARWISLDYLKIRAMSNVTISDKKSRKNIQQ